MDLYTLIVTIAAINAVFAVVYIIAFLKLRSLRYVLLWGISAILFAANGLFYLNAEWLPHVTFHMGSSLVVLAGLSLRYMAARDFGGRQGTYLQVIVPCLMTLIISTPFLLFGEYGAARTVSYFAFATVGFLATWEYARDIRDGLVSRYGVVCCYGLVSLTFAHRAVLGLFETPEFGRFGLVLDEAQAGEQLILLIGSCASAALCLAIAFEKAMNEQQKAALQDYLTGTMNRRAFEAEAERLIASNANENLTLVHADLDHFKKINDRFGHAGGDRALVHFVSIVKKHLNRQDVLARIGGEEFVLILPNRSETETALLLDTIRKSVEDTRLRLPRGSCSMTVSFGYTVSSQPCDLGLSDLMKSADIALYRAKDEGRNQVRFEPGPHSNVPGKTAGHSPAIAAE